MDARDENKALIRRFYAEIDAGNLGAMDELVAADYVDHHPPSIPGLPPGRAGLKQAFEIFWRSTPGTHEILEQIAEGDLVVTRIRARGRFAEDMGAIPATGGDLDVTATAVHRVRDGRLTEHWGEVDSFSLMQQLGLVPAPEPQTGN
jgi:predicted SnoaL-like aldol condensation-catalyzing enzyme